MSEWKTVGVDSLLVDGVMTEVRVGEQRILLARVQGTYYAVQALCTHMGAVLTSGKLVEFVLRCPRHGSQFDLRDGHVVAWVSKLPNLARKLAETVKRPQSLHTFPTRVQDGQVWVQID
jgi:nitrite reductase/ring-hydroxylating ferredoxin subunit